ncbi:hypothetical protein [Breznakiella homolactica]|uniref:Uncharacterized protein n=1 Tax=Breznakiella homolactica TaxID=2798577 RepID=A0A7T8BA70_9SPIR|nr:hypothetical protein [Breznakiella homolactica]QQO09051.1 hypothetical protein JFL75_19305 [Breznakiella homolactica]
MSRKIVLLLILLIPFFACKNNFERIDCNFTDDIVLSLTTEYDKLEYHIYFTNLVQKYNDFFGIEDDFFNYLVRVIDINESLNEALFFDKYYKLINNIPEELNIIFNEFHSLNNITYKDYTNFTVMVFILFIEEANKNAEYKNRVNEVYDNKKIFENVNLNNINRIKKLFSNDDMKIIENNKINIIENIFF